MTRTDLPDDLADLVQGAAGAVPPYEGDLAAVQSRGRARRRHRGAATAGVAALAVAVVAAAPLALSGGRPAPLPVAGPAETPAAVESTPAEPAQRLLVGTMGYEVMQQTDDQDPPEPDPSMTAWEVYEWYRTQQGVYGVVGGLAEVLPDGDVAELDLPDLGDPELTGVNALVPASGGGLALLATVDLLPDVQQRDGPCNRGLAIRLVLAEPDGTASLSRNVRVMCEHVNLLAVDAQTAYLLRGEDRLVAHDLATGDEQVLATGLRPPGAIFSSVPSFGGGQVAVAGHAEGPDCEPFQLQVTEVATGDAGTHRLPWDSCQEWVGPVRVSPDGRYVAVGLVRGLTEFAYELRVAVVDLADGSVVVDQRFVDWDARNFGFDSGRDRIGTWQAAVDGMAWADDRTLRVAWYEVAGEGMYWLPDIVQVAEVTLP